MTTIPTIGLLGHGRFGAALASLLDQQGLAWCAWDPAAPVPSAHAVDGPAGLAARARLIVVGVPLDAFGDALRALRPHLDAGHEVLDVCSVKEHPCRWMDELLGDAVGHAGTHPLFGPLSIARAEPLRAVLCPSPRHPGTAILARALFAAVGCEVLEQAPAAHDRAMAITHAMAFFVARGLVDLGVGEDLRWAPPSFAALAASLAAVRADAGHLFQAIQRQNPHAAATRRQFIDALDRIDRRLLEDPDPVAAGSVGPGAASPVAEWGAPTPALQETRALIDELDRELVALLRRRTTLSLRAAQAKRESGAPVLDPGREHALMAERRAWALEAGLPAEAVAEVFRDILALSRRAQA